jgi:hypothetical protein
VTKAYPKKRQANSEEMKSAAEHPEVPTEVAAVKTDKSTEEAVWEPASSRRGPSTAEEKGSGPLPIEG